MRKLRFNVEERRILELCDMFGMSYQRLHNECDLNFGKIEVKDETVDKTTFHPFVILYDGSDNDLCTSKEECDINMNPHEKMTARIVERLYSVLTESEQSFAWNKLMDDFEDKTSIDIYFLISFCYVITKFDKGSTVLVDNKKREDRAIANTIFAMLKIQGWIEDSGISRLNSIKEEIENA